MHDLIKTIIPIAKTIARMFGKNCEVVLHDFNRPQKSIVFIENGHVTGRIIGDPITDLALSSWLKGGFGTTKESMIINYKTKTKNGKVLKSSSVFIKDKTGKIVGCLCINYDMINCLMFERIVNEYCTINELNGEKEETFTKDVVEILDSIISMAIEKINKPVSIMKKEENIKVVEIVYEKGGFMIKGAVDHLAHRLNVSRFTIYNYLDEIKIKKNIKNRFI